MLKEKLLLKKMGILVGHIFFWICVLLFYTYYFAYGTDNTRYAFSFSIFILPITIATTYVVVKNLIPNYLLLKKYKLFVLYSIYTLIISSFLIIISIFYGLLYLSKFNYETMTPISKSIVFIMIGVYSIVILVSSISLVRHYLVSETANAKLQNKILETQLKLKEHELSYLKMQIHPHFLFNTLNTMYGFALKKSDKAPEMILKLSNLLDYLLYQAEKPFVLLTEEISHIKDYIELEQMRFNDTLQIDFKTQHISETIKVAPMLLLPFVENSFKHGSIKDGFLTINISISGESNRVSFKIKNTTDITKQEKTGIGLDNIKKRLEILYKDSYTLDVFQDETHYTVHLQLNTINYNVV